MKIHEKIRLMRQTKNLTQEELSEKLGLSVNGYAKIERGETDIQVSRLEEIAQIFEMDLVELVNLGEKSVVYISHNCNNKAVSQYLYTQNNYSKTEIELEKFKAIIECQKQEISYLKDLIKNLTNYQSQNFGQIQQ